METPHDEKMDCSFGQYKGPSCILKLVVDMKIDNIIPMVVDTGCNQPMLKVDPFPPHLGEEDARISMIYICGDLYKYQRRHMTVTVMGRMEELSVGFA